MMLWRRPAVLGAVLCLGMVLLSGCTLFQPDETNQVVLVDDEVSSENLVLHFFAPMDAASTDALSYRDLIARYNSDDNGVNVVFEGIPTADGFNEFLVQRLDTGQGDDLFIVNADTVKLLYSKGHFYDLSDRAIFRRLNDSAKEQAMIGDIAYCLPVSMTAYCLFVNLDVLEEYELQAPKNLAEFQSCCRTIKAAGGTPISLNRWYALTVPAMANGLHEIYGSNNTAGLRDDLNSGKLKIGDYMLDGFRVVEQFIDEGWYGDGLTAAAVDGIKAGDRDIPDFAAGRTAFYFGHLNAIPEVEAANPDCNYVAQGVPIPGGTVTLPAALTRLCVNANGENLEETLDFVDFLTGNKYKEVSVTGNGYLPIYSDANYVLNTERMRPAYETFVNGGQIPIEDMQLRFTYWDSIRELCLPMFDGSTARAAADAYNERQKEQIATYRN